MDVIRDPDGLELEYLRQHADFTGTTVLEIGCGDGRLTRQYARYAKKVVGIDSDLQSLRSANRNRRGALKARLSFMLSEAESLPFPSSTFNLAILAWSL